jgi:hypothetical protein
MAKREFDDAVDAVDDPAEIARSLDIAERAQLWIDRVREHALDQLQHQVRIPGWGLVPTRPTRKWVSDETSTAALLTTMGVPHDTIFETKLRSPAQIEKALVRTPDNRRLWEDHLAAKLVESKSSGVKLSRTGTTAGEDFIDAE